MIPREFKNYKETKDTYIISLCSPKLHRLCNKMALKRCTSAGHLWNRKLTTLTSLELWEIFLQRSNRSWHAENSESLNSNGLECIIIIIIKY